MISKLCHGAGSYIVPLHGPPTFVDKTNFGSVSIITLTFIGLRKHLLIGQLHDDQFFSAFHWSPAIHLRHHSVHV